MRYDIVSVGSATWDTFFRIQNLRWQGKKGRLVFYNDKVEVEKIAASSGGGGTNTATGWGRLGFKTACVARFGDDLEGRMLVKELQKERFDRRYLLMEKGEKTDSSVILLSPQGERVILVSRGKTRLNEKVFPWPLLKKTRFLYLASLEGNLRLLARLVKAAEENGVMVILNPGQRELKQRQRLAPLLPHVKMVIVNEEEAILFWGKGYRQKIRGEKAIVVVTLGEKGALWCSQGKVIKEKIIPTKVVDTTGAGDAFSVGVVAGLMWGRPPRECLSLGMRESASVVSHLSAKKGLLEKKCLLHD